MKRGHLITFCLLAAIIVIAFMTYAPRQREPMYEGKRLSEWLPELDVGTWPRNGVISPADQAIWNMGTNAFPRILRLLHACRLLRTVPFAPAPRPSAPSRRAPPGAPKRGGGGAARGVRALRGTGGVPR